jgi:hypothetical protein
LDSFTSEIVQWVEEFWERTSMRCDYTVFESESPDSTVHGSKGYLVIVDTVADTISVIDGASNRRFTNVMRSVSLGDLRTFVGTRPLRVDVLVADRPIKFGHLICLAFPFDGEAESRAFAFTRTLRDDAAEAVDDLAASVTPSRTWRTRSIGMSH